MSIEHTFRSPEERAADAVREVLLTQWRGEPAVRLDSPPGAGKTGVVERLAVQSLVLLKERCMIATQTNEQSFDIARRLAAGYPQLRFSLLTRQGLTLPPAIKALGNVDTLHSSRDIPRGPCVVIANAAKWSWLKEERALFDCLVVDEAFQLTDARFSQIATLARRFVLVGDPGQIAPVVACEVERWRADPAGPHVACPHAMKARYPELLTLSLPVSRRLVPDTVRVVQPAFYPTLPFTALCTEDARRLALRPVERLPLDRPLNLLAQGASLALVELPPLVTGPLDEELAETLVALLQRLFARSARVYEEKEERPLTPAQVGVVCAHVTQVNAIRERLPEDLSAVLVETAERFQGLEREVMFVYHPLSGRSDLSEFHLDARRLCVMMSRHRVACLLLSRGGVEERLTRHSLNGDRIPGQERDEVFEGWRAHLTVLRKLRRAERVLPL